MWSFGVILYLLITGHTPFNGSNPQELLENVLESSFTMEESEWIDFSPEARDLVQKLLIKNPSKRMTSEQALAHPWFRDRYEYGKLDPGVIISLRNFNGVSPL
jgi:serine/threonine protein kinase